MHRATLTPQEAAGSSSTGSRSLCTHCSAREGEIYARSLASVNSLEQQFGALGCRLLLSSLAYLLCICWPHWLPTPQSFSCSTASLITCLFLSHSTNQSTRTPPHHSLMCFSTPPCVVFLSCRRPAVGTVSTLPGILAPGRAVHQPRLPYLLPVS